jgi:hypothetical protein
MGREQLTELDVWSFKRDGNGRWTWQRRSPGGELLMESRGYFDDLDACQEDAHRHGYFVSQPA